MTFTLSQGSEGWQRGHGDVAAIETAVLIAVSGTSADNPPLLSTREKPPRFAMSGFVCNILCYVRLFLFGGRSVVGMAKLPLQIGFYKQSASYAST